jgi:hypothetical protein
MLVSVLMMTHARSVPMADCDSGDTSMRRRSERFALGGLARRAAELPDVSDSVPFGLTRTTIVIANALERGHVCGY